uniref:Tryptase gamma 1 n=1 Tax=Tetraselmis sp. GSL018 TaxID=582737 RepID=A0A061R1Y1_9CHLO
MNPRMFWNLFFAVPLLSFQASRVLCESSSNSVFESALRPAGQAGTVDFVSSLVLSRVKSVRQSAGPVAFVLNGEPAQAGRFPYIASLRRPDGEREHYCGGALIAPDKVITAAHCVDFRMPNNGEEKPIVHIGRLCRACVSSFTEVRTRSSVIHPDWDGIVSSGNDVAILTLERAVPDAAVRLAQPSLALAEGRELVVAGWGFHGADESLHFTLQQGRVNYLSQSNCNNTFQREIGIQFIKDSMLCAFSETTDACRGDSGGPLIIPDPRGDPSGDLLVGVVSLGVGGCVVDGTPAVYANLRELSDFIRTEAGLGGSPQPTPPPPPPPNPTQAPSVQLGSPGFGFPTSGCHTQYEVRWLFGLCPYGQSFWDFFIKGTFVSEFTKSTGLPESALEMGTDWGVKLDGCSCRMYTRVTAVATLYGEDSANALRDFLRPGTSLLDQLSSANWFVRCAATLEVATRENGRRCFS